MNENVESRENSVAHRVMSCEFKDLSGLNDFQKLPDLKGIAITKVGINRFRLPLTFKHGDGQFMSHDCEASMFVNLSAGKTGVNMSRLVAIIQEESGEHFVNPNFIKTVLTRFRRELKDYENEDDLNNSFLNLSFNYPMKQNSLKSDNWGWQYYACEIEGKQNKDGTDEIFITVKYEYSSTCPCSLSMAKQYEQDYLIGKTVAGNGIGAAHSQRSQATCKIQIDQTTNIFIEDIVALLRKAIPTETQSLVKRVDEQAFAILNGENPMFVEHASKRLHKALNADSRIIDWSVKLEHFESLHSHNAVAYLNKGLKL